MKKLETVQMCERCVLSKFCCLIVLFVHATALFLGLFVVWDLVVTPWHL